MLGIAGYLGKNAHNYIEIGFVNPPFKMLNCKAEWHIYVSVK